MDLTSDTVNTGVQELFPKLHQSVVFHFIPMFLKKYFYFKLTMLKITHLKREKQVIKMQSIPAWVFSPRVGKDSQRSEYNHFKYLLLKNGTQKTPSLHKLTPIIPREKEKRNGISLYLSTCSLRITHRCTLCTLHTTHKNITF